MKLRDERINSRGMWAGFLCPDQLVRINWVMSRNAVQHVKVIAGDVERATVFCSVLFIGLSHQFKFRLSLSQG
jgi:hypothetical protein